MCWEWIKIILYSETHYLHKKLEIELWTQILTWGSGPLLCMACMSPIRYSALLNLASTRWYRQFIATVWEFAHQNQFSGCWDMKALVWWQRSCMLEGYSCLYEYFDKTMQKMIMLKTYRSIGYHISATTEWILMNKVSDCSYKQAVSSHTCHIWRCRIPDGTRTCHAKAIGPLPQVWLYM